MALIDSPCRKFGNPIRDAVGLPMYVEFHRRFTAVLEADMATDEKAL